MLIAYCHGPERPLGLYTEFKLSETRHLLADHSSRIVFLLSRHKAHDKRYQLLNRLEVGRLHRLDVFDAPAEVPLLYGRVPAQLDHKGTITR
jgi:hypothetical protein